MKKTLLLLSILGLMISLNSCKEKIPGCMDATATNFNPDATEDDGSCVFDDPNDPRNAYVGNYDCTDTTFYYTYSNLDSIDVNSDFTMAVEKDMSNEDQLVFINFRGHSVNDTATVNQFGSFTFDMDISGIAWEGEFDGNNVTAEYNDDGSFPWAIVYRVRGVKQ